MGQSPHNAANSQVEVEYSRARLGECKSAVDEEI